jgi:hypothetical protein
LSLSEELDGMTEPKPLSIYVPEPPVRPGGKDVLRRRGTLAVVIAELTSLGLGDDLA